MFHKVKEVIPLENYKLEVIFQDNSIKYYNISKLFEKYAVFKKLKEIKGLYKQVKVDIGGYGVSWNDEIDISCNELWENGEPYGTSPIYQMKEEKRIK